MKTAAENLLKIIFYINLISCIFSLSCNLKFSNKDWLDEWRLLVTSVGNNRYQLLRDHSVAINNPLYMFCGRGPPLITAQCKANQRFDRRLPLSEKCNEIDSIRPTRKDDNVAYCQYNFYRVGFDVEINSHNHFLEAYQVCFDRKHMRPLFTINKVYPVGGGRPDTLQFDPDDIFYGKLFSAFSRRQTFARFKKLLGDEQKYMKETEKDHIIDRGHLSPSADFVTTNLKRSTFNMINVIPQFKTIDNGNWRLIEEWVRDPSRTPANVCNGVFNCNLDSKQSSDLSCVLQLKDFNNNMVPMFLADYRKIPIPLWSYKIVKNNQNSWVFLTYNNIYHEGKLNTPHDVCVEIECPLELPKTIKDGRTFCCSYNEFIKTNVPHLNEVC